jgi:F-type H+-transporting ATPase subunit b
VEILAVASGSTADVVRLAAAGSESAGLTINFFWVIVAALNFVIFLAVIWTFAFRPLSGMLTSRRERIEQGLKDAEQARVARESAEQERVAILVEARREANDIINRAQRERDQIIATAKADAEAEDERITKQGEARRAADLQRARVELRGEVASLALQAAGRVVGETMTSEREKRLVEEFLKNSSFEARG